MTEFTTPGLEPYLVLAQELMRHVYSEESSEEINAWLMAQVQRLGGSKDGNARMTWEESFAVYDDIIAKRTALAALPPSERRILTWPWESWAKFIDPLEPGMLAIIAAGDGVGKTIYAECLAEHWARCGRRVAFVHFELNRSVMMDRRTARHTGIPRRTLKAGELTPMQEVERQRSNDNLRTWRGGITYVHTPGWTTEKALSEVRAMIAEGLCDVFIVDYLEKASASPRQYKQFGADKWQREADDAEQIKSFSEQVEIPAVLLSQLSKSGKGKGFDDLSRNDIRGAGEKSEKANIVILIHRDGESQEVSVKIDKNTLGPTGTLKQIMDTPRFLVGDIAQGV